MADADATQTRPDAGAVHGPWNPGLRSPVPRDIAHLATLYRPENAFEGLDALEELRDFTGLPLDALVVFRPERLIAHELLVRMAADVSVPDGPGSEDLGIRFREMTATLETRYVRPHLAEVVEAYDHLRATLEARAGEALAAFDSPPRPATPPPRSGWLTRLGFGAKAPARETGGADRRTEHESAAVEAIRRLAGDTDRPTRVLHRSLLRAVESIRGRHGRLVGDRAMIARIAAGAAVNVLGSERVGDLIAPWFEEGVEREGYRRLPVQSRPVVMNTKGASAAGKSTMRPRQRALAERIGVDWADFALVSPDIFRKYLLDYDSLGPHYKYAGMFTGEELRIVDQKLDRYMAEKASAGRMSHLLIDRFRFDSFAPESTEKGSNLLTRFGHEVYLFFMVTPPHLTVERAWERGLRVGRYKTVDDLLYHNVEAFTGLPELFFTWAQHADKTVHYEFLDNDVPEGEAPRTIAFGANRRMVVFDVERLLDIERFRKIDVDAKSPRAVYPDADADAIAPGANFGFLEQCLGRLDRVDFADAGTARVYLRIEGGRPAWLDRDAIPPGAPAASTWPVLEALFAGSPPPVGAPAPAPVDREAAITLGEW